PFDLWSKIPDDLDIISLKKFPGIVSLFEKMDYYASCLEGVELRTALLSLTTEVYMNLIIETKKLNQGYEFEQTNEIISDAISYIERELKNIKSIEEIADYLYITKSHLHHIFIKHMGITPKKYITIKRLSLIQRELSLGAKPTEVYEKYGFLDYSTFYRAYKSHYNRPPSSKEPNEPIAIPF
ncbi:MAG: helix-turn-helix transcriptional regulator, partial [Clostridia bacterium]|nr:helix-turn-helix transcriptional regulator [Clostridia bacterium]